VETVSGHVVTHGLPVAIRGVSLDRVVPIIALGTRHTFHGFAHVFVPLSGNERIYPGVVRAPYAVAVVGVVVVAAAVVAVVVVMTV